MLKWTGRSQRAGEAPKERTRSAQGVGLYPSYTRAPGFPANAEQGVAMLPGVFRSKWAVALNLAIMRAFGRAAPDRDTPNASLSGPLKSYPMRL